MGGTRLPRKDGLLKLGKLPAVEPPLRLTSYIPTAKLPEAPVNFGWDYLIPSWPMFANDLRSCCVFSGAGHEHQIFDVSGKRDATFVDAGILEGYSAVTGFNPADPATDQGTVVAKAMEWRRTVGLADATGQRHRLAAYAGLEAYGSQIDLHQLASVAWLFGVAGIGITMRQSAVDQFKAGQPWDVAPAGQEILGGHYVVVCGRKDGYWHVVTWGKVQPVTDAFLLTNCDEAWAVVSTEQFNNGLNLDGLDESKWAADIEAIPGAVVTPEPARKRAPKKQIPA